MERQNFRGRSKKINKQAAQACVELFKEYDITELVVPTCSVESVDMSDTPEIDWIDVIKLDNPQSEEYYDYFVFHTDYRDEFSAGDLDSEFPWTELYDVICDTIEFYLREDLPTSEWCNPDNITRWEEEGGIQI